MVVVVSILILHILLKQINNYHSFVLSKSYAQCSVCDDHRRRYIHLILSLTRESFSRLVMKHSEREKNSKIVVYETWLDAQLCYTLYKNKRTHFERNKRAIKRNKCHWYQFAFHLICLNLFLGTSKEIDTTVLYFFLLFFVFSTTSIVKYLFWEWFYSVNVIKRNFPVEIRMSIYPWCPQRFFFFLHWFLPTSVTIEEREICSLSLSSFWRSIRTNMLIVYIFDLCSFRKKKEKKSKSERWEYFPTEFIHLSICCFASRLIKRKVKTDCNGKQKAKKIATNPRLRPGRISRTIWCSYFLELIGTKIKNINWFCLVLERDKRQMFVQEWWCTTWIVVVTMPCGLIVFDCYRLVIVVLLVEFVLSKSIFINPDQQREMTMSGEKLMKKDRRHSIFDDKNRAVLGELVSRLISIGRGRRRTVFVF